MGKMPHMLLDKVKMHYEDSHTSFAYSGYIPLWEITDGYVTFYPPKNVLDPVAWWRATPPPKPKSGEFLSDRPRLALTYATSRYIQLYGRGFKKVSKEKFPVKDTVAAKNDINTDKINDNLEKKLLEIYRESPPQFIIRDSYKYPTYTKDKFQSVKGTQPIQEDKVVKEYPSALGRKSTLMQEMIAADNDGRENDALILLKELEELWAIPDNKNKSIPSVFLEIIKEIINDIQKN